MSEKPRQLMADIMDQAVETIDMAIKNGVRMQEEASRWWSGMMGGSNPLQAMQREAEAAGEQTRPLVQETVEDSLRALDSSWRNGMDLFRKVLETGQSAAALQQKTQQLWEASISTLRTEMQAMAEVNARALERWTEIARENTEGMAAMASRQAMSMARRGTNGSGEPRQARSKRKAKRAAAG